MEGHADGSPSSDAHSATSEAGARAFMPGHSGEKRGAAGALLAADSAPKGSDGSARSKDSLVLGAPTSEGASEGANCRADSPVEISYETGSFAFASSLFAGTRHLLFGKQKDVNFPGRH